MNLGRAVGIGLAISAALVALYLWQREPEAPPAAERGPSARVAETAPGAPVAPAPARAAAPSATPGAIRAALAHAFHGARPPRAVLERLAAGDVAGVAREFAASEEPGAAIHLLDLANLCATAGRSAEEERGAPDPAALAPATRARLESWSLARHAWQQRFASGCATTTFDSTDIRRRLTEAGTRGDAASLERLATLEAQPAARLQSAALLGNPDAQFRLALGSISVQPAVGRSWLESAAHGNADAAAFFGVCLLGACGGRPADPAAARVELEAAARRGSLYAIGLLGSADSAEGPRRWSRTDALVTPVLPAGLEALGLDANTEYAWTALAATLATDGCFGFEFGSAVDALEARDRLERSLKPVELTAAQGAAGELASASAGAIRAALGCD